MKGFALDPIVKRHDGWYFWDETWSTAIGPWATKRKAIKQLEKYCDELSYSDLDIVDNPWCRIPYWFVVLTAGFLGTALFILLLSGLVMVIKNAFWI